MVSVFKPDIIEILQKEGIKLKKKGNFFWALCPLHSEKVPSFRVNAQSQRFYCFGCHERGDVVSFIQKFKGLSFKDAIRYLGIPDGKLYKPDMREIKKRELIRAFREWCDNHHNDLCALYRTLQQAIMKAKTADDVDALAEFYHRASLWLHEIEILEGNNDEAKYKLFSEASKYGF
jgi:DNA primase